MRYRHHITDLLKAAEQIELDFSDSGYIYQHKKSGDEVTNPEMLPAEAVRKVDLLHTKDDFQRKIMLINVGALVTDLYRIASKIQKLDEIAEKKRTIEEWYDTFDDYE